MGKLDLESVYKAGCDNIASDALSCHPTYYPEYVDIDADIWLFVHPDCHAAILLLLLHITNSC